jgi:hypothetical protein
VQVLVGEARRRGFGPAAEHELATDAATSVLRKNEQRRQLRAELGMTVHVGNDQAHGAHGTVVPERDPGAGNASRASFRYGREAKGIVAPGIELGHVLVDRSQPLCPFVHPSGVSDRVASPIEASCGA